MRTEYFIQSGQVVTFTKDRPANGLFSLVKFFKKMADRFHITYTDDCCEDSGIYPVRYNSNTPGLEYYDFATKTWTAVS